MTYCFALVVTGDYLYSRNEEQLGSGSYGTVYKGYHMTSGEAVAIKELQHMATYTKEVENLQMLRGHSNIVNILHAGKNNQNQPCIVMEYCDGGKKCQGKFILALLDINY